MNVVRRHLPILGHLALLAVLCLALLPTLSRGLAAAQSRDTMVEVCTAMGTKWVDPRGGEAPQVALDHCPLCVLSHEAPALPTAALGARPVPAPWQAEPRLFLQAPRTLFVWVRAPSRGPPLRA